MSWPTAAVLGESGPRALIAPKWRCGTVGILGQIQPPSNQGGTWVPRIGSRTCLGSDHHQACRHTWENAVPGGTPAAEKKNQASGLAGSQACLISPTLPRRLFSKPACLSEL